MSDNETLPDQVSVEQARSTRKRRSSIFQISRRFEDLDITKDDNEEEDDKNENNLDAESLELRAYIESLRKERKDWKEMLSERKSRRRNLQKERSIAQRKGATVDLGLLSESDRSFLLARPPYEQICKNINILSDGAVKVGMLCKEIETFSDRLVLNIERKVKDATSQIIDTSSKVT